MKTTFLNKCYLLTLAILSNFVSNSCAMQGSENKIYDSKRSLEYKELYARTFEDGLIGTSRKPEALGYFIEALKQKAKKFGFSNSNFNLSYFPKGSLDIFANLLAKESTFAVDRTIEYLLKTYGIEFLESPEKLKKLNRQAIEVYHTLANLPDTKSASTEDRFILAKKFELIISYGKVAGISIDQANNCTSFREFKSWIDDAFNKVHRVEPSVKNYLKCEESRIAGLYAQHKKKTKIFPV